MKKTLCSLAGLAALAFFAGCSHGPYAPKDTTKYTLENTDRFVLMDKQVQHSVTSTGIQQRINADGRLEVTASIKNRENRRIQVQVSCVFKDEQNFSTGDETPWQTLILGENTTEAVNFKSMNTLARTYTIRVRQAR
ncbi:MAG TPA: YcfL family protein [Rariglobus sp.]